MRATDSARLKYLLGEESISNAIKYWDSRILVDAPSPKSGPSSKLLN